MGTLKAKKADDLNLIIAKHLDILDGDNVSAEAIRRAESVANLIGKQLKVESVRISYEDLRVRTGKSYGFSGQQSEVANGS
ncbi:MAG: hypothetical protein LBS97_03670 [Treponema sp.]|jgi:hypothetical protein|nr:hypothetical protein [Treponema sp.]